MAKKKHTLKHLMRGLLVAGAVLALGVLGLLGWRWTTQLRCQRVDVAGARHAEPDALRALAQVDTGMVLFDIDPRIVADRVRRHPWVQTARVRRLPTGTLAIDVRERRPVVLALDRRGAPSHYLDRNGFAMPLASGAAYDVPVLRGLAEAYHPVRPVQSETVRALLDALARLDAETDALVSDVEVRRSGEVRLHTTPTGARGAIPVWLGRDHFAEKLARLRGFWRQAVLTQPEKRFTLIDLRYNSQIVTREAVSGQPSASSR